MAAAVLPGVNVSRCAQTHQRQQSVSSATLLARDSRSGLPHPQLSTQHSTQSQWGLIYTAQKDTPHRTCHIIPLAATDRKRLLLLLLLLVFLVLVLQLVATPDEAACARREPTTATPRKASPAPCRLAVVRIIIPFVRWLIGSATECVLSAETVLPSQVSNQQRFSQKIGGLFCTGGNVRFGTRRRDQGAERFQGARKDTKDTSF